MNSTSPQMILLTPKWLVVSKPSGWLTIPGRESEHAKSIGKTPLLSEWATQNYGPTWVVHRLDRETSGVVLFARTAEDHRQANSWFQERKVKKVYHCLASGIPQRPIFKIDRPIQGSPSTTQVEVRESYQEGFLARVFPRTGRRHQIRIHLSQEGFPLWGDPLYKGATHLSFAHSWLTLSRVALHASSLELPGGERFEAEFPEDFENWLNHLRKDGQRVS